MKLPANTEQSHWISPLGPIILAATPDQLVGLWFADQAHLPNLSGCPQAGANPVLQRTVAELTRYFAGQCRTFSVALHSADASGFQLAVRQALSRIPYGSTCSYAALAAQVGQPTAARAVGATIGRNPLSIIVPCHRVLGVKGSLTGYAGGLARKKALLQLEGAL